jgi:tetratricopeptide (TPR) repeat protein
MPDQSHEIARGICLLVVLILAAGFLIGVTVKRSEAPLRMLIRWVLTGAVLTFLFAVVGPMLTRNPIFGLPLLGMCGLVLAGLWRYALASMVAKPFVDLFDGGSVPPDPHPAYSVAQSRQKQGRYLEAVAEVRKQLERFPMDVEGQLLLAQIQAEDLKDLAAAEETIHRFCAQPGHAPQNLTFALYSLADWHLSIGRDREAARRQLERIIELLPESEFALGAAQRVAHLDNPEMRLGAEEQKKFVVTEGVKYPGLAKARLASQKEEKVPGQQAAEYVKHLEKHPLDTEVREQLATLYAHHYGRLDLASGELEQLINTPNQPSRLVVRWLNLLADLQIHCGADYDTVSQTLQRIVDRDPKGAAAETARKRIGLLKLELKTREKSQAVQLGSYEQNIGLKYGRGPRSPPA